MPMASHFNQANHSGKSILARAARLFYSRRGRRTNMNYYLLLLILYYSIPLHRRTGMCKLPDKKVAGKLDKAVQIRYKSTMTFCICVPCVLIPAWQKYDIDTGKE